MIAVTCSIHVSFVRVIIIRKNKISLLEIAILDNLSKRSRRKVLRASFFSSGNINHSLHTQSNRKRTVSRATLSVIVKLDRIQFAKARTTSRALSIFRHVSPDFPRGAFQRAARVRERRGATSSASSSHDSRRQRQRRRSRGQDSITRSITGLPRVPTEATLVLRDGDRSLSLVEENETGVCPREPPGSSFSPSRNVILPRTPRPPSSSLASIVQVSPLSLSRQSSILIRLLRRPSIAIYANGEQSASGPIRFRGDRDSRKADRIFRRSQAENFTCLAGHLVLTPC